MLRIQLPQPASLSMSLEQALKSRRSNRDLTSAPLTSEELAAMLWACAGITSADGRRSTASTCNLQEVSPYVLRSDGAWRWDAQTNELVQTTASDVRPASTTAQPELVAAADVTIVFVADHERGKTARPSGIYADAGAMAHSAGLAAAALGLAGVVRASFDHDALRCAMALPDHLEPVLAYTVGRAA